MTPTQSQAMLSAGPASPPPSMAPVSDPPADTFFPHAAPSKAAPTNTTTNIGRKRGFIGPSYIRRSLQRSRPSFQATPGFRGDGRGTMTVTHGRRLVGATLAGGGARRCRGSAVPGEAVPGVDLSRAPGHH